MGDLRDDPARRFLLDRLAHAEDRRESAPPGSVARLEAAAEARDIRALLADLQSSSSRRDGDEPDAIRIAS